MSWTFWVDIFDVAMENLIDEALELQIELKELKKKMKPVEEKLKAVKAKVARDFEALKKEEMVVGKGKVCWQSRRTNKVNMEKLCEEFSISESDLAEHTETSVSKFIVIKPK